MKNKLDHGRLNSRSHNLFYRPLTAIPVFAIPATPKMVDRDEEKTEDVPPSQKREIYPVTDLEHGFVGWEYQNDPLNPRLV